MGIDATLYLPSDVRVSTVCEVAAVLVGNPVARRPLDSPQHPGAWSVVVDGHAVRFPEHESLGGCLQPVITSVRPLPEVGWLFWGYEANPDNPLDPGARYMSARSRPLILALFDRLAEFFGGAVDFTDNDAISADRRYEKPRTINNPEDGQPWQDLEEAVATVKPITRADLSAYAESAAYRDIS